MGMNSRWPTFRPAERGSTSIPSRKKHTAAVLTDSAGFGINDTNSEPEEELGVDAAVRGVAVSDFVVLLVVTFCTLLMVLEV